MSQYGAKDTELILKACRDSAAEKASGQFQQAIVILKSALKRYPKSSYLLMGLGDIYLEMGNPGEAVNYYWTGHVANPILVPLLIKLCDTLVALGMFEKAEGMLAFALVQDPGQGGFVFSFANLLYQADQFTESIKFYRRSLCVDPDDIAARTNLAEVLTTLGMDRHARAILIEACELDPENIQARLNLAFSNMALEDFEAGLTQYEARLDPRNPRAPVREFDVPRWKGEDLSEKRILICAEQGVGEELRYSSFVPQIIEMANEVYLECDKRLLSIFERSFSNAKVFPTVRVVAGSHPVHSYRWLDKQDQPDFYIDLASIPFILGQRFTRTLPKVQLFVPDAELVSGFRQRLTEIDQRPWVGLHWKSKIWTPSRARYFASSLEWAEMIAGLNYNFFDLNYVEAIEEAEIIKNHTGQQVHNFDDLDQKNDLDGTAALMKSLDVVISAPTSVAVLAGCVGIPTLQLDPSRLSNPQIEGRDAMLPWIERIERKTGNPWNESMSRARARMVELIESA